MSVNPTIEFTEFDNESKKKEILFETNSKGTPTGLKNYAFVILSNKKSYKIDTLRTVDKLWKLQNNPYLSKKESKILLESIEYYVQLHEFEIETFIQKQGNKIKKVDVVNFLNGVYVQRIKQIEETILKHRLPIDPNQDVIREESSDQESSEKSPNKENS